MWKCSACNGPFADSGIAFEELPRVQGESIEMLMYQVSITRGVPRRVVNAADSYRGTNLMTADDVAVLQFLEREGLP